MPSSSDRFDRYQQGVTDLQARVPEIYQALHPGRPATDLVGWAALQWPGLEHVVVSEDEDGCRAEGRLIMAESGLISVRYSLTILSFWPMLAKRTMALRAATLRFVSSKRALVAILSYDSAARW